MALDAALLSAIKFIAAHELENSAATELSALRTKRANLVDSLEERSGRRSRLKAAVEVLDGIIGSLSLEAATKVLVNSTCSVASRIFSRIHAPNEYEITGDATAPLCFRGQPRSKVQLNEVSTGQRAAYALSMFLAMNSRADNGPKVVLLDDPISHVDDMNALAFLDYLRNLVLNTNRQIFFATADEKMAGLFAHKFGFLGSEFKMLSISRS